MGAAFSDGPQGDDLIVTSTTTHPTTGRRIWAVTPLVAMVAWTLFVWIGRIRNIVNDETLAGWSRSWRLGFSASFVALAVAVGGLTIRHLLPAGDGPAGRALLSRLVTVLAGYSIVVWLIRGTDITIGNHSVGFKVVHAILAVVSIGLGGLALRWVASQRASHPSPS
jgi:hypothetical protein